MPKSYNEPWYYFQGRICCGKPEDREGISKDHAFYLKAYEERVILCVNALRGIPSEWLEKEAYSGNLNALLAMEVGDQNRVERLRAEQDRLLKVVKALYDSHRFVYDDEGEEYNCNCEGCKLADAAIKEAEESSLACQNCGDALALEGIANGDVLCRTCQEEVEEKL